MMHYSYALPTSDPSLWNLHCLHFVALEIVAVLERRRFVALYLVDSSHTGQSFLQGSCLLEAAKRGDWVAWVAVEELQNYSADEASRRCTFSKAKAKAD